MEDFWENIKPDAQSVPIAGALAARNHPGCAPYLLAVGAGYQAKPGVDGVVDEDEGLVFGPRFV